MPRVKDPTTGRWKTGGTTVSYSGGTKGARKRALAAGLPPPASYNQGFSSTKASRIRAWGKKNG